MTSNSVFLFKPEKYDPGDVVALNMDRLSPVGTFTQFGPVTSSEFATWLNSEGWFTFVEVSTHWPYGCFPFLGLV